jgi:hypothetical protein
VAFDEFPHFLIARLGGGDVDASPGVQCGNPFGISAFSGAGAAEHEDAAFHDLWGGGRGTAEVCAEGEFVPDSVSHINGLIHVMIDGRCASMGNITSSVNRPP